MPSLRQHIDRGKSRPRQRHCFRPLEADLYGETACRNMYRSGTRIQRTPVSPAVQNLFYYQFSNLWFWTDSLLCTVDIDALADWSPWDKKGTENSVFRWKGCAIHRKTGTQWNCCAGCRNQPVNNRRRCFAYDSNIHKRAFRNVWPYVRFYTQIFPPSHP